MKKSVVGMVGVFGLLALGIVGLFSVIFGGLDFATAGAVSSADSLLQNAAAGNTSIVRQHLAIEYSNTLTDDDLNDLIKKNKFDKFQAVNWQKQSVENNFANLEGQLITATGSSMPVTFSLVHQQGVWRVDGIQSDIKSLETRLASTAEPKRGNQKENQPAVEEQLKPTAAVATSHRTESALPTTPVAEADVQAEAKPKHPIPTEAEAFALVTDWTGKFHQGIVSRDFADFHSQTAPKFQKQIPLDEFTQIFKPFVDQQIDLAWVENCEPRLKRAPMIDSDGVVFLAGQFQGESPLNFEYRFVQHKGQLKPLEVFLQLEGNITRQVPGLDTVKGLVIDKTLSFGEAVHDQDFSAFHRNQLADQFRSKYPVGKFAEIFRAFLNERASLDWIEGIEPEFEVAPSLNTDGVLQAQGSFPSEPRVDFRYAFVQEDATWKLVLININVPPEGESTDEANAENAGNADTASSRR